MGRPTHSSLAIALGLRTKAAGLKPSLHQSLLCLTSSAQPNTCQDQLHSVTAVVLQGYKELTLTTDKDGVCALK